MQLSFFNTIQLSGQPFAEATARAINQDGRVLKILKEIGPATPLEVSKVYDQLYPAAPVTSIRRSMTVLTKKGLIEQTGEMKQEQFGKPNNYWRVRI